MEQKVIVNPLRVISQEELDEEFEDEEFEEGFGEDENFDFGEEEEEY
ncbi:MAG: hypothetical protein KGZ30_04785 [Anaplasmataceae bacterium]|nr:hypothetical protein [Anaplasmataceae bacterium]